MPKAFMRANLLPIVSLLASTFFLMAGAGLHGILLPVRASMEGWSPYEIGLIGTGYAVAFTIGCLVMPAVVRRAGHVRSFSCLAALLAVAVLLNGLIVQPFAWILVRGLAGFALAGAYMVIESWLNERVTNTTRGMIFSLYMAISMAAMMGGQFVMPLAGPESSGVFMLCAIFYALAVLPTSLSKAPAPKPLTQVRLDIRALFANSPAAVAGVFVVGLLSGAWTSMAPVFGQTIGLTTTEISILLVSTMFGGLIFQVPIGRLSDRGDRRVVMGGAGLLGFAIALVALTAWSSSIMGLFAIATVIGGTIYPTYSVAVAHANDHARPEDFVMVSGGLLILYGFGTMAGPMLAAALMEARGPNGIFIAIGASHLVLTGFVVYRITRRSPPAPSERDDFLANPIAPVQTPATIALDPRAKTVSAMAEG